MAVQPKIETLPDAQTLARCALELFTDTAQQSVFAKNSFDVAISGGHTPKRFFELLAQTTKIQWDKVRLFWVDERYVSPDSDMSNFKLASDTFLNKVPIPPGSVHRILTEYSDIRKSAKEYEQLIRIAFNLKQNEFPQFDLIFLGLGPDGHIASLFPDSAAVYETKKLVTTVQDSKTKPDRVTLTAPVLCAAAKLVILISGTEKAAILKQVLTAKPDPQKYPVHLLWPVLDKITLLTDFTP